MDPSDGTGRLQSGGTIERALQTRWGVLRSGRRRLCFKREAILQDPSNTPPEGSLDMLGHVVSAKVLAALRLLPSLFCMDTWLWSGLGSGLGLGLGLLPSLFCIDTW